SLFLVQLTVMQSRWMLTTVKNSLSVLPVKTQVITSAALWAVGDVTTHSAASKKRLQLSVTTTIPQVKEDLKRNYFPALVLEGGVWPIVQIFNFRKMQLGNNGFNHFILLMEKEVNADR
ncbi:protein mpv17, partial [Trifolium pratense]